MDQTTWDYDFVNAARVPHTAGEERELVDPATGETYDLVHDAGEAEVRAAMRAAAAAFEQWRETTPAQRQHALLEIADALEEYTPELAAAEL
ncbi:MAG TPA: aldehyde dehydrogenase family protein, partial [Actinospica sp.]|nr:aldehyde dehydrogenase family protein [Actinospica sp.]